jgi:stage II sporulation protein D
MVALCAVLMLALGVASASARSGAQYRIEGGGYGHGIGMSQYGAHGYALHGWTAEQIIRHYFTGTVVAPRPSDGPTDVRVLLQSHLKPARLQMVSAGVVTQGVATLDLAAGDIVELRKTGAFLVVTRVRTGVKNQILSGASRADAVIVPQVDGGVRTLFTADNRHANGTYRGTFTGHLFSDGVSIVNTVPFESYLRGVVPWESPSGWPAAALEAQAIAARSYALRGIRTTYSWFDLYSDTQSQMYGGIDAERETSDAAVTATANLVARVKSASGEVAQTFFFSTSPGRTAGNNEVWGSSPYSYLRSVASPYETDSPYMVWKGSDVKRYTPRQFGAALGYATTFRGVSNTNWPSGYAKDVTIRTSGNSARISGSTLQSRLGLRSSYFNIRYLSIVGPNSMRPGAYMKLTGRIPTRGVTTLLLRRDGKTRGFRLRPVGALGTWTIRVRATPSPLTATLTRSHLLGPRVTVAVAPTGGTTISSHRRHR